MKFTATKSTAGKRLDRFLTEKLSGQTRSQIQKLVKSGQILLNDRPTKVHHFLKEGNVIEITELKKQKNKKIPMPALRDRDPDFVHLASLRANVGTKKQDGGKLQPTAYPSRPASPSLGGRVEDEADSLQPKILSETPDFLVIEKPAGLLVHATDKGETNTLVDWLIKKYPAIQTVGEEKYRAGIIHRLDKDVSGIMIVAKNNPAYYHLKEQFKARKVKKNYIAMVYGRVSKIEGEIDLPIGRSKEGRFVAHPRHGETKFKEKDKIAKTEYNVLEYIKDYTLLNVQIATGRTHQIRAHLTAIGHPILGDQVYKPKNKFFHFLRRKIKVTDPGRIFLHSRKIGFYGLNNQWAEFTSPLPKELTEFLNGHKTK